MRKEQAQQAIAAIQSIFDRGMKIFCMEGEPSFAVRMDVSTDGHRQEINYLFVLRTGELPEWVADKAAELHAAIEEQNDKSATFQYGGEE